MNPTENLNVALQLHQSGKFSQAEIIYRQILAADKCQADAWHLLGLVHYQRREFQPAIEHIRRAIELRPRETLFLSNLGEAYRAGGQWSAAEDCYRRALEINPQYASALNNLGVVLSQQGQLFDGLDYIDQALRLKPDYAEAHYNRGLTLSNMGRAAEAMASYREALRWQPRYAAAWNNLGLSLHEEGQTEQALECYEQAIRWRRNRPTRTTIEATRSKSRAGWMRLSSPSNRPWKSIPVLSNRSITWELPPAPPAVSTKPSSGTAGAGHQARLCRGDVQPGQCTERSGATECGGRAVRCCLGRRSELCRGPYRPGDRLARKRRLCSRLARIQWRWKRAAAAGALDRGRPLWNGAALAGRTIMLTAEQGLGDTLNFVRYARRVKERGGRVVLECQPPLVELLARTPGIDAVVAQGQPPADWEVQAPLLSLPGLFGTTLETIPAETPYVFPDAELAARWRKELAADARLKVGVAWRGNPRHLNDRFRSFAIVQLETLADERLRFYSLQKDITDEERAVLTGRLRGIDLGPRLIDFNTTAAVVANLDLVITCDSTVAHLAGAIGVKAWVAIPFAPDWRWLLEREDSPWYPSLRLFRQRQPGNWAEVFRRMRAQLEELLAQK